MKTLLYSSLTIIFIAYFSSCITSTNSDSSKSMVEDADAVLSAKAYRGVGTAILTYNGATARSLDMVELIKKYPIKPILGEDTVRKIFTNHYGEIDLNNDGWVTVRDPWRAYQVFKEGEFYGKISVEDLKNSVAFVAWSWEMFYNRGISIDSLEALTESEIVVDDPYRDLQNHRTPIVESAPFKSIPFKWYKVTSEPPKDMSNDKSYVNYVTVLDNRLFVVD
jgi:hypothetical protein